MTGHRTDPHRDAQDAQRLRGYARIRDAERRREALGSEELEAIQAYKPPKPEMDTWVLTVLVAQQPTETTVQTAKRLHTYTVVWQERYGEPSTLTPETVANWGTDA